MRYPRSSYSDQALAAYDSSARQIDQAGVTSGRAYYLRGLSITNTHASSTGIIYIYDTNTEGASPTETLQRLTVIVGPNDTAVFSFPAPGIKFLTGMVAGLSTAGATIPAYGVTTIGYEE